ncbi:SDR family NAD(P)-dependent oxidoreductase, partial [Desulfocurvibacter africanus]
MTAKRGTASLSRQRSGPHALVTGGAGFIGTNLSHRLAGQGRRVLILDNLSRPGGERNLAWLKAMHGDLVTAQTADVRDARAVASAVQGA